MQIEIVNVGAPAFVKTAKGGYNIMEVAYKTDGKVTGKKILDFVSPEVYNTLLAAQSGAKYVVEMEKNEKGFFEWLSLTSGGEGGGTTSASPAPAPSPGGAGKGRVVGNTYETPEERALNRAAIIRQSSINMALEYVTISVSTLAEVLTTAGHIEDYIYDNLSARAAALKTTADALKTPS